MGFPASAQDYIEDGIFDVVTYAVNDIRTSEFDDCPGMQNVRGFTFILPWPNRRRKKNQPQWVGFFGIFWSAREDLNLRPLTPHDSALPGCATCRYVALIVPFSLLIASRGAPE